VLQYALTAAPAAQPRNILFGQSLSIVISILISYIPYLALPWKQIIALSISVATMSKLGCIHPPAGAATIFYSTGYPYRWTSFLTFMITNVICIFIAAIINNMSNKRQYPMYWGVIPPLCHKNEKPVKEQ
jgi:CBS-domain-containing membrane protein